MVSVNQEGFARPPKVTQLHRPAPQTVRGAELSARARLEQLFDEATFLELDAGVEHRARNFGMDSRRLPGDGVICGFGQIDGEVVYAYSQDRAVLGGSLGEAHAAKIAKIMQLAEQAGRPLVGINDSGGARIQEGVEALAGYGEIFRRNVRLSGVVPQISLLMGPCAGGAVYSPALTDFVVMVDKKSFMFVTGPKVVRAVTSEDVDTESLGGGQVHATQSGVAHFLVANELAGLHLARRLLSYFPANNCDTPPTLACEDPPQRSCTDLRQIVPTQANRPYEAREVVERIVDAGSFLEVHAGWAANVRIGLARLNGQAVAIFANNPAHLAGVLDIDASRKAARFIRTCDAFGLPLISLVDVPGFLPGSQQEHAGIIDHGAKLAYAMCEMTAPKISLILRKAYGGAYIVMSSKTVGGDLCFAWPSAEIAVMGAAGAVEILHAKAIKLADDPAARSKELEAQYNQSFANPRIAQARGLIDAVIEPEQTRAILCQALRGLAGKRAERLPRRHGNVPL